MSGWFVYATKKSVHERSPTVQILAELSGGRQEWKPLLFLSGIQDVAKVWKTKKDAEKAKRAVQKHRVLTLDWRHFEVISLAEFDRYRIQRELT